MKARFHSIASLLLLLTMAAQADEPKVDEAKVDAYIRTQMEKNRIPGASVVVVRDGKVALSKGYGFADLEHKVPARPDTVYQLASVTKQFTAAATLLLMEDGKLSLDDYISKHLPNTPPAWSSVTVRHLLNHTSGIHSYTSLPDFEKNIRHDYKHDELIGLVRSLPLDFEPGAKWEYNNTGYYLLGMIIERVSGKSYGEFLAERIFRPLGMTSTRVNDQFAVIPNRAQGYTGQGSDLRHAEFASPTQPFAAGALVSTVEDMAKWDLALSTDVPLKAPLRLAMWTATKLNGGAATGYGYGWQLGKVNGHAMQEHGGGIPGFSTQITRFPEDRLSVIVLTNREGGHAGPLALGIAATAIPELAPKPEAAIEDKNAAVTEKVRKLLLAMAAGSAEAQEFTPEMQKLLFPDRIKEAQGLFSGFGPLKMLELLESREEDGVIRRRYRATFGDTRLTTFITINKEGKFAGVGFRPE